VSLLLTTYPYSLVSRKWDEKPNGVRYPRVGGTRGRQFDGTNFKPRNLPENATTPTRRVHAVLGGFCLLKEKSVREEVAQVLL
jgi:hypothetical protein